jgi:3-methyladenine DNA glycosylase AlkC
MEPFKNLINAGTVGAMRRHLQRVAPKAARFDGARFERLALDGLDALEFKARAQHVCAALEATLPADFDSAATLIEASLASMRGDEDFGTPHDAESGLAGWAVWPLSEFVARRGMETPERALATLHALTQRFTAEWAIRPFIERHPELAFATLARWAGDRSPQVRRLVSEGSRPRLPWGLQLKGLIADPSPTLPLLLRLQDDESDYVRRSVANHLNDIAKDHPAKVAEWLAQHLPQASAERRALLRHASRSLIKRGDAQVLKAWGLGRRFAGDVTLAVAPRRVTVGGTLEITLQLTSTARSRQKLAIDYAVHHVKANGSTSPKVFKGWVLELAAGESRTLVKRHSLKPITTRVYYPGAHLVDVRLNGEARAEAGFTLKV